ncbi:MAG: hypothetical protein JWO48_3861 [Bryobacterales bacterium]|nr:hypothetical protein [Bryobacterales bacterium]
MLLMLLLLAIMAMGTPLCAQTARLSLAPSYTSASVVNSATNTADALAPNAIASIYGSGLSFNTQAASQGSPLYFNLPVTLAGVRVYVAGLETSLYYVSPWQINFVIPNLRGGDMSLYVTRQGITGPHVTVTVHDAGPGLYEWSAGMIASTHADGSVITEEHPARAGEIVVLYGTGLGHTDPDVVSGEINSNPAQITQLSQFHVSVAGTVLDGTTVYYAGVTPGIPGLYQVNVKLPDHLPPDPEIRIGIGNTFSPAGLKIAVR